MTKIALCVAALAAASYLVVPLPFTPVVVSLHTIVVNLIGLMLKPRYAAYTLLIYLLMGLIGLPVFAGGTSGAGKLLGPTGGYYFGFFFAAIAIALLKGEKASFGRYFLVTALVGMPLQHVCAILFMCLHNGFHLLFAALTVSIPFLVGDAVKCIIASTAGTILNSIVYKR